VTTLDQRGIRALLCTTDGVTNPSIDPAEINRFIGAEDNLLWLDIDASVATDVSLLRREFGFHELALEDALRPHQRSKIDTYDGYSLAVFYTVTFHRPRQTEPSKTIPTHARPNHHPRPDVRNIIHTHQLALFVGHNYLVTVHRGELHELEEVANRWQQNIDKINRTIGSLVYSLLDTIVDEYFPVIDQVADMVDEIEQAVFEQFDPKALEDIFTLKKSLLSLRRIAGPERDMVNVLIRRDAPIFGSDTIIYFQDVYDHLVRVVDAIDVYRDLLSSALDAYLSMTSNRLNQVMKTLTSWSIPLMASALLAGIWGMNFEYMPELKWRLGYVMSLGVIGGTFVSIVAYFRRKTWL
jgi:magnesium transporter